MNGQLFNQRALDMALRSDFVSFIHKVVMTVNPSHQLQENWHIFAIAWHLEQVLRGDIKRLIICLPPRNLKSIISSVSFPAWALGLDPTRKIVSITYGAELAAKYSIDFRRVITSPWFRQAFLR